jgi:hypothetical protein
MPPHALAGRLAVSPRRPPPRTPLAIAGRRAHRLAVPVARRRSAWKPAAAPPDGGATAASPGIGTPRLSIGGDDDAANEESWDAAAPALPEHGAALAASGEAQAEQVRRGGVVSETKNEPACCAKKHTSLPFRPPVPSIHSKKS